MRTPPLRTLLGSAAVVLSAAGIEANSAHQRAHHLQRATVAHAHAHARSVHDQPVRRNVVCPFPTDDDNLVPITPNDENGGWAMSQDQPCKPDSYCPFACKPGMVMNQWDPTSTYTYPLSMVRHPAAGIVPRSC